MPHINTIIIGAGQAGLATSYALTQHQVPHIVFERDRIAEAWRRRWDSFCLVTPNWSVNLPGYPYQGADPDGFMQRDEVVGHLTGYAASFDAPVREHTPITSLRRLSDGRFEVEAGSEVWTCCSLVLATGAYQRPHRPDAAKSVPPDVLQIDTVDYDEPNDLPGGKVVVVGNGQSGSQIAHELALAGREVLLACGRAPWLPRRVGDRDLSHWIVAAGVLEQPASEIEPEARFAANAVATGKDGGYDLNARVLRKAGVTLTGRFTGAIGSKLHFANDLAKSIAWSDEAQAEFRSGMRKLAAAKGWEAPEFDDIPAFDPAQPTEIDLSDVGAVIYATGYRPDFSRWLPWPEALDSHGFPIQQDGRSIPVSGLYFVGLHFLRKRKSSLLAGVGEDAMLVAEAVAGAKPVARSG